MELGFKPNVPGRRAVPAPPPPPVPFGNWALGYGGVSQSPWVWRLRKSDLLCAEYQLVHFCLFLQFQHFAMKRAHRHSYCLLMDCFLLLGLVRGSLLVSLITLVSDSLRVQSILSTIVFSHSLLKHEGHWTPSDEAKGKDSLVLQMWPLDVVLLLNLGQPTFSFGLTAWSWPGSQWLDLEGKALARKTTYSACISLSLFYMPL